MEPTIRPARERDAEIIATWTQDTFEWGDYVADALPEWMAEDDSLVLVAERDSAVIGVSRVLLLSPAEAWAQGTRIHPEHRRSGVGMALARHLEQWAAASGAQVMRSMVEEWNEAARNQSLKLGYRDVGGWVRGTRGVGDNSPVPEGNGGRRVAAAEGLRPANSSEAEAAVMSWSGGPLERAARGLIPIGTWRMRRLVTADLAEAAKRKALLSGRAGWAIGEIENEVYEVSWISATDIDVQALLRALIDRAAAAGTEEIKVMLPSTEWLVQALRRRGFDLHPVRIYAKSL